MHIELTYFKQTELYLKGLKIQLMLLKYSQNQRSHINEWKKEPKPNTIKVKLQ